MSQSSPERPQATSLSDLDELLIRKGLAALVPSNRRAQGLPLLRLILLLLGMAGLVGLPLPAVLLLLVLALLVEAIGYSRQRHRPLFKTLARPHAWARIRRPFYGTLMLGLVVVGPLVAREPLLLSLVRLAYLWLCLRTLESTVRHPERYVSLDAFQSWLQRLERRHDRVWETWLSPAGLALAVAFVLNLAAPGIWESVGNAAWSRLFVFGGGLYLLALYLLDRDLRLVIHAAMGEGIRYWDKAQLTELGSTLDGAGPLPPPHELPPGESARLEVRLAWKNVENLVSRVRQSAEDARLQQLRWSTWAASVTAFLLVFCFLAASVFLIVPREVITHWVAAGQPTERQVTLAFDDFGEFLAPEFWAGLLEMDWPDLGQEPLLKVTFLEASIIVTFLLFRTVAERPTLRSLADPEPLKLRQRLGLGIAYLILLEDDFQYLGRGVATRQLAASPKPRLVAMRNDVLLAPSTATKAGVYRAVSGYLRTYGQPEGGDSPYTIAVFAGDRYAQEWALRFLRFLSPPLDGSCPQGRVEPEKFWIWSGEQLATFSSLEEAQWYGRFVAGPPMDWPQKGA